MAMDLSGGYLALFAAYMMMMLVICIVIYVYMAITLMTVAKKMKHDKPWLAWIPVGNLVLMSDLAKMHWWPVLLIIGAIIPFIGILFSIALMVFIIIWEWKICEARGRPGWWAVLIIIPFLGSIWNLVMWGILAWGK